MAVSAVVFFLLVGLALYLNPNAMAAWVAGGLVAFAVIMLAFDWSSRKTSPSTRLERLDPDLRHTTPSADAALAQVHPRAISAEDALREFGLCPDPGSLTKIRRLLAEETGKEQGDEARMLLHCVQLFAAGDQRTRCSSGERRMRSST
ncbi:MAG TPA: hypothetical protein VH913_07025 [Hyphomicrobiaceae bacterium]